MIVPDFKNKFKCMPAFVEKGFSTELKEYISIKSATQGTIALANTEQVADQIVFVYNNIRELLEYVESLEDRLVTANQLFHDLNKLGDVWVAIEINEGIINTNNIAKDGINVTQDGFT